MMQQLMAAQTQLMTMMAQFMANQNGQQPPPPPPPQVDRLARFLRLRPKKILVATEPIMVDDWLHAVHNNLITYEWTDAEKVRFTAHLLEGPAARWWETFQITHPLNNLTWETFWEGFRNAHISSGAMNLKQEEFRKLRQGNRSLKEYMDNFQALSRYAPDDIDTEGKRKEKFLRGLSDELKIPLSVAYAPNYQTLLDQAIILEDGIKKAEIMKRSLCINTHDSEPSFKKPFSHDNHRLSGGSSHHGGNNHHGGSSRRPHGHNHNGSFQGNHLGHRENGHAGHNQHNG